MQISRELFDEQRRPRFGIANPERMEMAFWEWMIRGDEPPPSDDSSQSDDDSLLGKYGFVMREGIIKSSYGPYRARDLFQVLLDRDDGPIWTFDRMGATRTELPDGRVVCIGGEHEDAYDPDFCIYNDVVVFDPDGRFEIYGYPKEIFPPTDFHTANLIGDRILIVGSIGYLGERRSGHTPVYVLHLSDYRIEEVLTWGEMPGWIFKHEAEVNPTGEVIVRGGEVQHERDGKPHTRRNIEEFALDLRSWTWRQVTSRNWLQFAICRQDQHYFPTEPWRRKEELYPVGMAFTPDPCDEWNRVRFRVSGVVVEVTDEFRSLEVIVEGDLQSEVLAALTEILRANLEAKIGYPCVAKQV